MDNSAAATPVSQPPLATQLVQSELQQSHSQESIIANLRQLSDSLSAFQRCFSDLQRHIDSIRTSIDSMLLPPQINNTTPLPVSSSPPAAPAPEPELSWESDPSEEVEEEEDVEGEEKEKEKEVEKEEYDEGEKEEEEVNSPHSELKSPRSELEIFCETMDSVGLREYMITHLSDIHGLREEAPKALILSPRPASLVFKCMGKFYIKGSKGYVNDSPLIQERKAKVLLLECFLLMMRINDTRIEIEKWVKEEAEQAALAWLKRMNFEGGVLQAQEIDARGLLLFIGCFGIPDKFKNANISNLLRVSNINWVSDALRRSNVLMAKFPEIIKEMVTNKTVVKAVHIAYSVGMQDKFNPKTLLTSFLRESKKSFDRMKGSQGAHQGNIGGKRKYLNDLQSVIKCLGFHNVDPLKLLPGWQINLRIMSLEKEIAEFNKQIADQKIAQQNAGLHKRKTDETEWLGNKEVKRLHFSNPWPPQQQRVVNHVVSNNTLLQGGGTAGHNYGYSMSPWVLHGPVAYRPNTIADDTYRSAPLMESSKGLPNTIADDTYRPTPLMESSKGLPNTVPGDSNRPPPYLEVSSGLPNTITGDAYRPASYMENSKGLPNTIPGDANRPPPYLEGSTGLPNTTPPPYQFADTVPATELYQNSGSQAVDAHPSSSLYWQR